MTEFPAFGTHPIKCGKRGCAWTGYETDLHQKPMPGRIASTQSTCPSCGCESYSFLGDKAAKKWLEARHKST